MSAAAFRQCLAEGDYRGMCQLQAALYPHLPRPKTDTDAEVAMHMARTQTGSLEFRLRAWSHRWLTERSLPSQMPDHLKPQAERMYPRVVAAVGIGVKAGHPDRVPLAEAIQGAMSDAVLEMFADGVQDSARVTARMQEARRRVMRGA